MSFVPHSCLLPVNLSLDRLSLCRFAGLTVMHKFQISGGKVMYRNRHLNREAEHYIEAENQEPGVMLWNDPCGTVLGRAFSLFKQAGQAI